MEEIDDISHQALSLLPSGSEFSSGDGSGDGRGCAPGAAAWGSNEEQRRRGSRHPSVQKKKETSLKQP
jgi:hypothetical protein